jgi:hypothetical protein
VRTIENDFGQQLTEAIKRIKKATRKPIAAAQGELGYAVGNGVANRSKKVQWLHHPRS